MSTLVALLAMAAASAWISWPLLRPASASVEAETEASKELWEREKFVALTAIREAEFDQATGKLSDEDYEILRSDYEERAMKAMAQLEGTPSVDATATATASQAPGFCVDCGQRYGQRDRFCAACGRER
ncbi:MAG: hypothetical protein H8E45_12435 [Proteobacteria bacterium]|nr:hypothetical protein [Pseudomonadota bacterium]